MNQKLHQQNMESVSNEVDIIKTLLDKCSNKQISEVISHCIEIKDRDEVYIQSPV